MRLRPRTSILVMLALLSQQLALATHACPREPMPPRAEAMAGHCAGMGVQSAEDSHTPDTHVQDNLALCNKHCAPDVSTPADQAKAVLRFCSLLI